MNVRFDATALPLNDAPLYNWQLDCTWTSEGGEPWLSIDLLRLSAAIVQANGGTRSGSATDHALGMVYGIATVPLASPPRFDFPDQTSMAWHVNPQHRTVLEDVSRQYSQALYDAARQTPSAIVEPWLLLNDIPFGESQRQLQPEEVMVKINTGCIPLLGIKLYGYADGDPDLEREMIIRTKEAIQAAFVA